MSRWEGECWPMWRDTKSRKYPFIVHATSNGGPVGSNERTGLVGCEREGQAEPWTSPSSPSILNNDRYTALKFVDG